MEKLPCTSILSVICSVPVSYTHLDVYKRQSLVKTIEKKIAMNEASIRLINSDIKKLNEKINALQRSIDERNAIIIKRMQDEQATIGTNMSLEIIMGSQDLLDMIRKIDGLNRINEQDQREIDKIKEEKQEQNLQKSEKVRLKTALEETKSNNEKAKKEAEEVRKQKQVLLDKFRKQEEALDEKMRSVKVDISTICLLYTSTHQAKLKQLGESL